MTDTKDLETIKSQLNTFLKDKEIDENFKVDILHFLESLEHRIDEANLLIDYYQNYFNQERIEINMSHNQTRLSGERSIKKTADKNTETFAKFQAENEQLIKINRQNLKKAHQQFDQEIEDVKHQVLRSNHEIENIYNYEKNHIQNMIIETRNEYQLKMSELQDRRLNEVRELKAKLKTLKSEFQDLQNQILRLTQQFNRQTEIQKEDLMTEYRQIITNLKTNHTKSNININQRINDLKREYQETVKRQQKLNEEQLDPLYNQREKINENYHAQVKKITESITQELDALNHEFDRQKIDYETTKNAYIKERSEAISVVNTKLTLHKQNINKQKEILTLSIKNNPKNNSNTEIISDYNRQLKRLDNELNRHVIQAKKDLAIIQKEFAKRFYLHDIKHIENMNTWRYERQLRDYQRKYLLNKLDAELEHSLKLIELQLREHNMLVTLTQKRLYHEHLKKLIPLETQINLSSLILNRESKLADTETTYQMEHLDHTHKIERINLQKVLLQSQLDNKLEQIETIRKLKTVDITLQLEIEIAKQKRDLILKQYEYELTIADETYRFERLRLANEEKNSIYEIEFNRKITTDTANFEVENIRKNIKLEFQKREYFINKARAQYQKQLNIRRSQKNIDIGKIDTNENFKVQSIYTKAIYSTQSNFKKIIRGILKYTVNINEEDKLLLTSLIYNLYLNTLKLSEHVVIELARQNEQFYEAKIEETFGYKFMRKHEELISIHDQEKGKLVEQREIINEQIKKHQAFILEQSTNINKNLDRIQTVKQANPNNYRSLIKPIVFENQQIRQTIKKIENQISELSRKHKKNQDKLQILEMNYNRKERQIAASKRLDAIHYYRLLNHHKRVYKVLNQHIQRVISKIERLFINIKSNVLTDKSILLYTQKIFKYIDDNQRKFVLCEKQLNRLLIKQYTIVEREQNKIINDFEKFTERLNQTFKNKYEKSRKFHEDNDRLKTLMFNKDIETQKNLYQKEFDGRMHLLKNQSVLFKNKRDYLLSLINDIPNIIKEKEQLIHDNRLSSIKDIQSQYQEDIKKAKLRHAEELLSLNNDISNVKHQMSSSQKKLKSLSAFHINLYKSDKRKCLVEHHKNFNSQNKELRQVSAKERHIRNEIMTSLRQSEKLLQEKTNDLTKTYAQNANHILKMQRKVMKKENTVVSKSHNFKRRMFKNH